MRMAPLCFIRFHMAGYTIRELSAPYGYHPSAKTWEVTVDGTYQNPIGLLDTVVNEDAPGRIRILKQDALDQHVIAGVCFDHLFGG